MGISGNCQRVSLDELRALQQCRDETQLHAFLSERHTWPYREGFSWGESWVWKIKAEARPDNAEAQAALVDLSTDGTPISSVWFGYGPVRYLLPVELLELVDRLRQNGWRKTLDDVAHPPQPPEMHELVFEDGVSEEVEVSPYPFEELDTPPPNADGVYELDACSRLVRLYGAAALAGDAVVFWLG